MGFRLTIAQGNGAGRRFRFAADRVSIGRGAGNEVVLNDAGISRSHARIERRGDAWVLFDSGSVNGTALNGSVISGPVRLRNGDRIGVGPAAFRFHEERAPALLLSRFWRGLSTPARTAAVAGATLITICAARAAAPTRRNPRGRVCPEAVMLGDQSAALSFGHGAVEVDCGAVVVFGFQSPPDAHPVFHYTPLQASSRAELEVRLNGAHLGWASGRPEPQAIALPPERLAKDGRNFVEVSEGEPGKEWSVRDVRLEVLPAAAGDLSLARAAYERGRRKLDDRRIAPRNLYDAWQAFTEARRQLDALPQKPALYTEVARLAGDAERDLSKQCRELLFSAARYTRYGEDDKAQQVFREILLHFPGDDPEGCRRQAEENLVSGGTEPSP